MRLVKMMHEESGRLADVHPAEVENYTAGGYRALQGNAQAEEVSGIPSKSDIAGMKKADVIEWLEAHGVEAPSGSVAELREQLRAVMFMDN